MGEKDKTLLELRGFSETRDKKCSGRAWLVVSLNKYQLLLLPAWNGALPTKGPVLLWDWKLLLEKAYTQACTDMCMHTHACTRMYTYVCAYTRVYIHVCMHTHTCMCMHTHKQVIFQDPALSPLRKPLQWGRTSPHPTTAPDSPSLFSTGVFTFYLPYF